MDRGRHGLALGGPPEEQVDRAVMNGGHQDDEEEDRKDIGPAGQLVERVGQAERNRVERDQDARVDPRLDLGVGGPAQHLIGHCDVKQRREQQRAEREHGEAHPVDHRPSPSLICRLINPFFRRGKVAHRARGWFSGRRHPILHA